MPPSTADASKRYGLVVDAGSSGSRLQIYSWKSAQAIKYATHNGDPVLDTLPRVEKGAASSDWVYKVEPGISTLGPNPKGVSAYLRPLLEHAMAQIPPSHHADTPIFLLATAGMRLLPSEQQTAVIKETCSFLRFHTHFKLEPASDMGPCGLSVRIITGVEEGLFGWIAVNYLMDGFAGHENHHRATFGFLDMGGASTQIAFEPSPSETERMSSSTSDSLAEVRLRLLSGEEIVHRVFVTTWLGYGTNQARTRFVNGQIEDWQSRHPQIDSSNPNNALTPIPDPCLPLGLTIGATPPAGSKSPSVHSFIGTGNFTQCVEQTAPLLNKDKPCPDVSCLFNGVPAPAIDFSLSRFIGVSEYWYSSEHVFGLGGAYDYVQYERAAAAFCGRNWDDIVREHNTTRHTIDTTSPEVVPAEVVKDGAKAVKGWGKEVGINRLQMQCFKAAWIVNMLHEGIGLPRIVDKGGNLTSALADQASDKAIEKGLGRLEGPPTFQSLDSIGDTAISWTLGKMVLEASKEVPPIKASSPPLVDPNPHNLPLAPPVYEAIPSLPRRLLSHTFPFFYFLVAVGFAWFAIRVRRAMRSSAAARRRRLDGGEEGIPLYESIGSSASSPSSSPPGTPTHSAYPSSAPSTSSTIPRYMRRLWRIVKREFLPQSRRPPRLPKLASDSSSNGRTRPAFRQTRTLPASFPPNASANHASPKPLSRQVSFSFPTSAPATRMPSSSFSMTPIPSNGSNVVSVSSSGAASARSSRSGTPTRPTFDETFTNDEEDGLLTARPRPTSSLSVNGPYGSASRNSSQLNLTAQNLVPRAVSSSSRLSLAVDKDHE